MSVQQGSLLEVFEGAAVADLRRHDPVAAAFERGRAEGLTEGVLAGRGQGREEGRAEGFEAGLAEGQEKGRAEGRASASQDHDATLAAISETLVTLAASRADAERRFAATAAATVRAATAALLPRLGRRGLADEVAAIAGEICAGAAIGAATLRIAPDQEQAARAALQALSADGLEFAIALEADERIGSGGARLEWRDGFMAFDADEAAAQVLERLDAALTNAADPSSAPGAGGLAADATGLV